jgi:hypothetical protein
MSLNSQFNTSLNAMLQAAALAGHKITVGSGYRSPERQQELWDQAVRKYGSPEAARKWVAPPGKSKHNQGLAADLQYDSDVAKEWAHQNAGAYGLHFRMSHEPWHIEPLSTTAQASAGGTPTMSRAPYIDNQGFYQRVQGYEPPMEPGGLLGMPGGGAGLLDMQPSLGDSLIMMGEMSRRSGPDPHVMNMVQAKQEFKRDLVLKAMEGPEKTALERQLEAAGFVPGTAEYRRAMLTAILRPSTQVNVGGKQTPTPIPGTQWVDPKDASKGFYPIDPQGTPTGGIEYLPGSPETRPSDTTAKGTAIAQNLYSNLAELEALTADPDVDLTGIGGIWQEYRTSPNLVNKGVNAVLKFLGVSTETDPKTAKAVSIAVSLRNYILSERSGAAVSPSEQQRFEAELPTPGQDATTFQMNIQRTMQNIQYIEESIAKQQGRPTPEFTRPASMPTDIDSALDQLETEIELR